MNYPKRGELSDDGKYYTHTDGSVHERVSFNGCNRCSLDEYCDTQELPPCGEIGCANTMFSRAPEAYVPSDEEQSACVMARAMINNCHRSRSRWHGVGCEDCVKCTGAITSTSCEARVWLAKYHQPDAWEVKP